MSVNKNISLSVAKNDVTFLVFGQFLSQLDSTSEACKTIYLSKNLAISLNTSTHIDVLGILSNPVNRE